MPGELTITEFRAFDLAPGGGSNNFGYRVCFTQKDTDADGVRRFFLYLKDANSRSAPDIARRETESDTFDEERAPCTLCLGSDEYTDASAVLAASIALIGTRGNSICIEGRRVTASEAVTDAAWLTYERMVARAVAANDAETTQ